MTTKKQRAAEDLDHLEAVQEGRLKEPKKVMEYENHCWKCGWELDEKCEPDPVPDYGFRCRNPVCGQTLKKPKLIKKSYLHYIDCGIEPKQAKRWVMYEYSESEKNVDRFINNPNL